mgnify:FL=1|jgi:hypothetical protein
MAQDVGIRNVDELRQFSGNLQNLGNQMSQIFHNAENHLRHVSEGWHDEKNDKFAEEFSAEVRNIDLMSQKMIEHATYLNRLCDIAEQYKSMR